MLRINRNRHNVRATSLAVLAGGLCGCLSGGPPPSGHLVLRSRAPFAAQFVPSGASAGDAAPAAIVLWQLRADGQGIDAYSVVDPGPGGGVVTEMLLAERVVQVNTCACQRLSDSRGRIPFLTSSGQYTITERLVLADPRTGERTDLGTVRFAQLSPGGQRLLYTTDSDPRQYRLRDSDGAELVVGQGSLYETFIGDDFYYADAAKRLWRLPAGSAVPEPLAGGVSSFSTLATDGPPLLLLDRSTDTQQLLSVLDLATASEQPLPARGPNSYAIWASGDGRWLLLVENTSAPEQDNAFTFIERATGATQTFHLPAYGFINDSPWRPHHDEAWLSSMDRFWTVRPGSDPAEIARVPTSYQRLPEGIGSTFAGDGRYWFSAEGEPTMGHLSTYVGSTDDPAGARYLLNPPGTTAYSYWQVPDGRLLVQVSYGDFMRNDLMLIDPATGSSRLVGETGMAIAVGAHRMVAIQHWAGSAGGDLGIVDLESGATTRLAEGVAFATVEPVAPGQDPLAAGTRIAYMVANQVSSPYDGLWVATLP